MRHVRHRRIGFLAIAWVCLCCLPAVGADAPAKLQWEQNIKKFEEEDLRNPPPKDAVLFVGSSGIRRWNTLAQDFPEHKVINRGFGGSCVSDSVYYADRIVIPYHPRVIVLRAGSNDIAQGKSPEQVAADFQAFVEKVRGKLPDVKIVFMSNNAMPGRLQNVEKEKKASQLIKQYIDSHENLVYVNMFDPMQGQDGKPRPEFFVSDKIHCTEAGYRLWTSLVAPHLK